MKQLTALDATFLHLESAAMPMHVGALHVFELPAGFKGQFVTRLRSHMAQRLPLAPVLRRRLWWMPLNLANPAWVDAEPDLRQHIVAHRLPATAKHGDGMADLQAMVGQLHGELLPRDRPLWRMHVLEGLAPGRNGLRRVGLFTQFHHAAVDGQAAVALAQTILDLQADAPAPTVLPSKRHKVFKLGAVEMLRGAIAQEARQLVRIVQQLPGTAEALAGVASQALQSGRQGASGAGGSGKVSNLTLAPRTPLNVNVQAGRSFAALALPLEALKAHAKAHGGTLNDIVLYLCSTGLRRYLASHGGVPRKSLVAAVPISLRAKGDTSASNQASMSLISLGTQLADGPKRLAHIMAASANMKATVGSLREVMPTDLPSIGVPWLTQALVGLYGKARVAERVPPIANVVISNVPGPAVPLFLAGAHMLSNHPTSIVAHGMALNITVQSYHRSMDFGLVADAAAMPDLQLLADAIQSAYDDLALLLPQAQQAEHPLPKMARAGQRLLGDAQRQLVGRVSEAVGGAMRQAVQGAVTGALKGALAQGKSGSGKSSASKSSLSLPVGAKPHARKPGARVSAEPAAKRRKPA